MWVKKDILGQVFGKLTVIGLVEAKGSSGEYCWLCRCACGAEKIVSGISLRGERVRSCGCLVEEVTKSLGRRTKISNSKKGKSYWESLSPERKAEIIAKRKSTWSSQSPERKAEIRSKFLVINKGKNKGKLGNHGVENPCWRGGVSASDLARYETYASRLLPMEEVRRDSEDPNILNVKCTYCGKWIRPNIGAAARKVRGIEGKSGLDGNFYCEGTVCRSQCSIYRRVKYPKGHRRSGAGLAREVQPELRKMVFERDGHVCQRCGAVGGVLHCHHIIPVAFDPIESADMDVCTSLCIQCHIKVHHIPGCTSEDLKCREVVNG
jgi:hypothetical protein